MISPEEFKKEVKKISRGNRIDSEGDTFKEDEKKTCKLLK